MAAFNQALGDERVNGAADRHAGDTPAGTQVAFAGQALAHLCRRYEFSQSRTKGVPGGLLYDCHPHIEAHFRSPGKGGSRPFRGTLCRNLTETFPVLLLSFAMNAGLMTCHLDHYRFSAEATM
ncbi:hypothetical protein GCM10007394_15130 [Salinibacterium amurskyense]|nr:hypothetical protein GCM10007394_15130 [Salinibacterium amurskyense]